jgi:hypothetical protein
MVRIALAAGALGVVALVVVLVIEARPGSSTGAAVPVEAASPALAGDALTAPGSGPRRLQAAPAPSIADASPLPGPDQVRESRARVLAEHERSPHRATHILDNNFKAKPMRDARKAFARGDYPLALERAEDALAVEPDASSARVLAAMAACGLGESAIAQAHANKLDDMRKSRVAQRCSKLGVELSGVRHVPDDL